MISGEQLGLFVTGGIILNLTPGPDVLFIVSQSLRGGFRAGVVAALGITAGCFVHVIAAAMGLGALLAASASAFNLLKWGGAAYLVWIGVRILWSSAPCKTDDALLMKSLRGPLALMRVFLNGFATNVLNPKVALFFLAFVPQFISADVVDPTWSFVMLGSLFNLNGLLICLVWAGVAARLSLHAHLVQRAMLGFDRVAGILFVGFGLRLAFADAPRP